MVMVCTGGAGSAAVALGNGRKGGNAVWHGSKDRISRLVLTKDVRWNRKAQWQLHPVFGGREAKLGRWVGVSDGPAVVVSQRETTESERTPTRH